MILFFLIASIPAFALAWFLPYAVPFIVGPILFFCSYTIRSTAGAIFTWCFAIAFFIAGIIVPFIQNWAAVLNWLTVHTT